MTKRTARKTRSSQQEDSPYRRQERLITPAELRFLHTGLQPAAGKRFFISVQTPLTAVLAVDEDQWDRAAGRRIRQKRLDFVLVYPKTFRIVAAIELDDRSHQQQERRTRDEFVEAALAAAGVPLLRFPIYRKYDPRIIRRMIEREIRPKRA